MTKKMVTLEDTLKTQNSLQKHTLHNILQHFNFFVKNIYMLWKCFILVLEFQGPTGPLKF